MKIHLAEPADFGEMYTLHLAAFVDEARLYGTPDVPPLNESILEFKERLLVSDSWIATDKKRIVGAVSLRAYRGVPDVERIMVAPDRRGESVGSALLTAVEQAAIEAGHTSIQLVVGDLAVNNQSIYEYLGWHRTKTYHLKGNEQILLHDMTKELAAPKC